VATIRMATKTYSKNKNMLRLCDLSHVLKTPLFVFSVLLDGSGSAAHSRINFDDQLEASGEQFSMKFQPPPRSAPEACSNLMGGG